jgi:hypothetical protein
MRLELDHFFILTEMGAPAASLLSKIGMIEGSANNHPGQGTSNRRFFFANAMLELLYIRDDQEAASGSGYRLHLVKRAIDETASPFGLVFRTLGNSAYTPFSGWQYSPKYLNTDQYFTVAENSDCIEEPLCIHLPSTFSQAVRPLSSARFDNVTEVRVCFPSMRSSSVLESIGKCQRLSLAPGKQHLMEIIFNGNNEHQSQDFRPSLPLIVRW